MAERKDKTPYMDMALSGALSGALAGAGGRFVTGARHMKDIAKAGGIAALLGGAVIPAGAAVGNAVLGDPKADEGAAWAKRGGIGGAIAGGLGGAALGGLAGTGRLGKLASYFPKAAKIAEEELPLDNMLVDKIKNLKGGQLKRLLVGSGLGAAMGAPVAGYFAGDEGQQIDTIQSLRR